MIAKLQDDTRILDDKKDNSNKKGKSDKKGVTRNIGVKRRIVVMRISLLQIQQLRIFLPLLSLLDPFSPPLFSLVIR